jgi:hypothetical protein
MSRTTLLLVTGEQLEVEGGMEEAAKALENAARSSAGTLAWLQDAETQETLGVNPLQVVSVRDAAPGPPNH